MAINYGVTKDGSISIHITGGFAHVVSGLHPARDQILEILEKSVKNREANQKVIDRIKPLIDPLGAVKDRVKGLTIHANGCSFNGKTLRGVVVDKIVELSNAGKGYKQLALFLTKVMENPSDASRECLFNWLESAGLIIDQEGNILGYKSVRADNFRDHHTNTVDNSLGANPKIPREAVDSNRNKLCSYGFHVGTLEYARTFGSGAGGRVVVVVQIHPKDVVSVPSSSDSWKIRVCEYKVIDVLHDTMERLDQTKYLGDDPFYDDEEDEEDDNDEFTDDECEYCGDADCCEECIEEEEENDNSCGDPNCIYCN